MTQTAVHTSAVGTESESGNKTDLEKEAFNLEYLLILDSEQE